jgi:dTDP-L-rhamnose 4-epimerase
MALGNVGTVVVTGGAGFIGCGLSRALAARADRWIVLDSLHPQIHASARRPDELHDAAELIVGDVTDPGVWDALLARVTPDIVVHLAAETGTAQSLNEASRHARTNVVGTTEMLDAFGRAGVLPGHLLLSSSRAVYGEGAWKSTSGEVFYPGQRSHRQLAALQQRT